MTTTDALITGYGSPLEFGEKDPELEISEPVEPLIYWIENTTPVPFRDLIKEGRVLELCF